MATVAPSVDPAGLLQNLSLDSQSKTNCNLDLTEPNKKLPTAQIGKVDSKVAPNGYVPSNNHAGNPFLPDVMDSSLCYGPNGYQHPAYYYGGYDGTSSDWDEYSRYINPDGTPVVCGDNGSLMYHHGYAYAPYGPYSPAASPVPAMGHDSQLYGHQQYQYPSSYFSPMTPTPAPTTAPQVDLSSAAGQLPISVETAGINTAAVAKGGGKGTNGSTPFKPDYQNSSFNTNSYGRGSLPGGVPTSGYQDPGFGFDGLRSPNPWLDVQAFSDGQPRPMPTNSFTSSMTNPSSAPSSRNQTLRSHSNVMGQTRPVATMGIANGYMNRLYPSKLYGQYGNAVRTGMTFGSSGYYARSNGRGWFPVDSKYKNRGRPTGYIGYGNENMDGMNELNRGPRAKGSKIQKSFTPVTLAVRGQSIPSNGNLCDEKSTLSAIPDRDQHNLPEFPDTYSDAKFFIIKSYSEDDIHKSIKYSVWSSTPNGNKKLNAAYQEAQEKSGGCPVFLFFSVNASGQFVGLAEMAGSVDFEKNVEYWQQDKWNGNFTVKWHIVKDVPNSLLKHIILENNENKPVTNSRDTQEVKLEQGLQLIKLFKEHSSKTCILDDFGFYEGRQKMIQDKKAKQQQFQKQVWEGKNHGEKNKDGINGEQKPQKVEVASPVAANGDAKLSENGASDAAKSVMPVSENVVLNGVANGD